jgi:hypothetical protein
MLVLLVLLVSVVTTFVYASLFEWAVHRYLYHAPHRLQIMSKPHLEHHLELYPPTSYYEWKKRYRDYRAVQPYWLETAYVIVHVPILWWLGTLSLAACLGAAFALIAYAAMTHYVHPFIHLRTGHKYEKSRWFKYLLKRHIWHHRDMETNFNTVFPFGDWLFGTTHQAVQRRRAGKAARSS